MSADVSNGWRSWPFKVAEGTGELMTPAAPGEPITGDGTGTALPVLNHDEACERGTVDLDRPAKCVGCGCTDQRACAGGCSWLVVDRAAGDGVCSNCGEHLAAWNARRGAQEGRNVAG